MKVEVSNPHYHPGPDFDMKVTKKRDLSVPPHYVCNERVTLKGKSYAIVMPPRDKELWEDRQPVHIHIPEYAPIMINKKMHLAKVKVSQGEFFMPIVHFDNVEAEENGIKGGEEAIL